MILDVFRWYLHIWVMGLLFQTLQDSLAETVLHMSGQFGFLSLSAGSVFWIVGPAIIVYFGARQLFKLAGRDGEACHWLKMAR